MNHDRKGYDPKEVEKRWYDFWEENDLFHAEEKSDRPPFSIVIPPPNVTGVLHMGHALNNTLQDILCRYRRLLGDNVLWMPGCDHAGIATQNVVERMLASEGKTRHEVGRKRFIERVWEWKEKSGSAIINQLKRLGASCDWKRERFTMDEGLSRAVRRVFVELYKEGLIYRGDYIINWCPRCSTALADLEVEHEEIDGNMYRITYPLEKGGGITIATTRPETMLGDTAVAVNPEDSRYSSIGPAMIILPFLERRIPLIKDRYVDMSFGTGALKVTPAHDPNDFEIGLRHELPRVKVIGEDGRMTEEAGPFAGLDRFECRKQIVAKLKENGLLVSVKPHRHSVGHCYRCKTPIEPNLSKQWFVKTKPLAEKAIAAVKEGRTRIIPPGWLATYYDWMENIRDWCISRQIWWGHRIPAWTCTRCGHVTVDERTPESCQKCQAKDLQQETDVLDTWFSSALWPFSTMGWPDKTDLLLTFYPTNILVTGFDILFFWVARMMMMGIHFMKDVPFYDVYVHALVRDEEGQKMSKSKGNVIDPIKIIDEHGADAFRFTLAAFAAQGRDVKMSEKRVVGYRHFINKLWNASRLILSHVDKKSEIKDPACEDRWILSRLGDVTRQTKEALDTYRFNDAASVLYKFVWHEMCDWYLEIIKPALYGKLGKAREETVKAVLWRLLHDVLILLHPIIPFITEELWHRLPGTDGSIMRASFPGDKDGSVPGNDAEAEAEMSTVIDVVSALRNIRGEMNIPLSKRLEAVIQTGSSKTERILAKHKETIILLARLSTLQVGENTGRPPFSAHAVCGDTNIFVPLSGIVDFAEEKKRLDKEIEKICKENTGLLKKLNNQDFIEKAPAEVVEKVRTRHTQGAEKLNRLKKSLKRLEDIAGA